MTDQMLIADVHEEIVELKQQLDEANAHIERLWNFVDYVGNEVDLYETYKKAEDLLKATPKQSLALHDAEVIEKAIKECSHKYDEYSWDNILGYAQQLRDSVKEGE